MLGVNKVIVLGRLGQDPEVRVTPSGQHVCSLRVATSETWMKDGQKEERTEWHRVVLWGRQAELAGKYLRKGRSVYVEGKLQTRSWDDAQSGQKRYSTEIVGSQVQFLDSASGGGSRAEPSDMADVGGSNNGTAGDPGPTYYGGANSSAGGYDAPGGRGGSTSAPQGGGMRGTDMDDDVPF